METDLSDLNAFLAVARAQGFRDGARASGSSASGLSEAVRRLETQLGVRLLNRKTRSVVPAARAAYPEIRLEVIADDSFVDVLAAGCDAGIRYDERLEQDMIAVPIGPRQQRFSCGASPAYLDRRGRPEHPRDLLGHTCLQGRFPSGATMVWEFERDGEVIKVDVTGPLTVTLGGATGLLV